MTQAAATNKPRLWRRRLLIALGVLAALVIVVAVLFVINGLGLAHGETPVVGTVGGTAVDTPASSDPAEIKVLSYVGRYRPKDEASTRFEVVLSIEQMTRFAIDEVWEVSDGQLFILDDDGTRRSTDGLPKISKRRERAIFGTTASN